MAAFRQIYSSAMWYLSEPGQGWAEEKWAEFKRKEWGNNAELARMDIWNTQLGRMVHRPQIQMNRPCNRLP